MRLLLDTHVAVWSVLDPKRMPSKILRLIERSDNFVSAISIFELSLKFGSRRGRTSPIDAENAIVEFDRAGFEMLDLTARHALELNSIALAHNDPFDRILLAQALSESLRFVTHDESLSRYSDTIISW